MKSSFLFSRMLPLTLLLSGPLLYSADLTPQNNPQVAATQQSATQSPTKELSSEEDIDAMLKSGKPTAIKVYANWCGACKMSEEPFKEACKNYLNDVNACTLNFEDAKAKAAVEKKFGKVEGLPTIILVDKAGNVRKELGSRSAEEFETMFISLADKGSSKEGAQAAQAQTKEINNQADLDAALNSGRAFIIDAWAPWCGACKISKEPMAKAHAQFADKVDLYLLNTDNKEAREALQKKFGKVEGLPTFILVPKDGKNHCTKMGSHSYEQFVQMFSSLASGKTQAAPKPVAKPAAKPEVKPQAKPVAKPEPKASVTPDSKRSKDIRNQQDLDAAVNSGRPFIIDVWAEWCGACKISKEPFARAHEKYKDQVDAYLLNYDSPKAREAFNKKFGKAEGLPTLVLVTREGKTQKELGSRTYEEFVQMFKKLAQAPAVKPAKPAVAPAKKAAPVSAQQSGFGFGRSKRREVENKRMIDEMELDELLDDEDDSDDSDVDDQDLD